MKLTEKSPNRVVAKFTLCKKNGIQKKKKKEGKSHVHEYKCVR